MPGSKEEDFYPKNYFPLGSGGGHEIYNFLSPYPTDATYLIWLRFAPLVFEKILTDDGRQPIAIGHPSHSGDLKNVSF